MKFQVYYAVVPVHSIIFDIDLPFSVDLLPFTHRFVREVDAPDRDRVFGLMQGEVWATHGEARELIASLGLSHTSMSVGDVIHDIDGWWMCADFGWKQLPATLTPEQRTNLIDTLQAEVKRVLRRGRPFSETEQQMGGRMIAWQRMLTS